jgi:hypothetical protein
MALSLTVSSVACAGSLASWLKAGVARTGLSAAVKKSRLLNERIIF